MRARALGIGLALAAVAAATTIDPLTFEELVRDAHFIGIVECETAGAIVARYRVIESWKGPEAGTKLTPYSIPGTTSGSTTRPSASVTSPRR